MLSIDCSIFEYMRDYHQKSNSTAITYRSSKFSFERFFKEIEKVAASFYKLGIRKGDIVINALPNIPQSVVSVYALSKIGAIASMVHPKISEDEFEKIVLEQSPKAVLLSNINYLSFGSKCGDSKKILCSYLSYDYIGLPRGKEYVEYNADGSEPMFYMQSGGTAGKPKTIILSHRAANAMSYNLLNYLDDKFDEKRVMLTALPMFHCFGLCAGVHASLCSNMGIVLLPQFSSKAAIACIKKSGVTTMLAVPRMVTKLLDSEDFCKGNIDTLEDLYLGGDSVREEMVSKFNAKMKSEGLKATLSPGYGLSEAVISVLTKGQTPKGSIGKPLVNVECIVVDDDLNELPNNEVGELLIASDQIMSGYLNDEKATKETLVSLNNKTYVKTGDYFKKDDEGFLYYMGRKKRLIKISGMNVFPSEIERIAKELDFVKECVAIELVISFKSFIRLLVEGNITEEQKEEVLAYIESKMSHWSVPKDVVCVEKFPLTRLGKIDVEKLSNEYSKD